MVTFTLLSLDVCNSEDCTVVFCHSIKFSVVGEFCVTRPIGSPTRVVDSDVLAAKLVTESAGNVSVVVLTSGDVSNRS